MLDLKHLLSSLVSLVSLLTIAGCAANQDGEPIEAEGAAVTNAPTGGIVGTYRSADGLVARIAPTNSNIEDFPVWSGALDLRPSWRRAELSAWPIAGDPTCVAGALGPHSSVMLCVTGDTLLVDWTKKMPLDVCDAESCGGWSHGTVIYRRVR